MVGMGFELRMLHLLDKSSTTGTTLWTIFALFIFHTGSHIFFPEPASDCDNPNDASQQLELYVCSISLSLLVEMESQ
jgi:hypothetical protein